MQAWDSFRRAIWAQPHDVMPRLVYADWLEERGQPERAEFIRLQCESALLPPGPARTQLRYREQALRIRHLRQWRRHDIAPHADGPWHLGFLVPTLIFNADEFLAADEDVFASAPLWIVHVAEARGRIEELLAAPAIDRVYGLGFPSTQLRDEDVFALARNPRIARLVELSLGGNAIGSSGLETLAACPHAQALRLIDLSDNHSDGSRALSFSDAAITAFARSAHLKNLETARMRLLQLSRASWMALLERFGSGLMWDYTPEHLNQPIYFHA